MRRFFLAAFLISSGAFAGTPNPGPSPMFRTTVPGQYHVNGTNGSDSASCKVCNPCATIAAAVAKAATFNASNPTLIAEIVVSPGTYAETITLNDANLRKLYIRASVQQNQTATIATADKRENYTTTVTTTAITSTTDNMDLNYLVVEGIRFTGASTLTTTATGTANSFMLYKGVLRQCYFESTFTVTAACKLFSDASYFHGAVSANNVAYLVASNSAFNAAVDIDWDSGGVIPQRFLGTVATANTIVIPTGFGDVGGYWAMTQTGMYSSLNIHTAFSPFSLDLGSGVYIGLYENGAIKTGGVAETWASGSGITFIGGGYITPNASRTDSSTKYWHNNGVEYRHAVIREFAATTSVSNADIDTGTESVDEFADTYASGARWTFVAKKGSNLRAGTMIATWSSVSDTVAHTETATPEVGTTTDLTLSVDINSDTVRLRAAAASDDWSVTAIRDTF